MSLDGSLVYYVCVDDSGMEQCIYVADCGHTRGVQVFWCYIYISIDIMPFD